MGIEDFMRQQAEADTSEGEDLRAELKETRLQLAEAKKEVQRQKMWRAGAETGLVWSRRQQKNAEH